MKRNIETFNNQLKKVGLSFDWDRAINTCDPTYYKWTQWLFLQLFKKGLAYKANVTVNYCSECGVLANEEVEDGKCCQCKGEVVQKPKSQWILKMTDYAERLDNDLDKTNYLPHIKASQRHWIGKSEGTEIEFKIKQGGSFKIFTTCPETIFGITFMVWAPENPLVEKMKDKIKNYDEVRDYVLASARKNEFERAELQKDKTGCILEGLTAINPVNNEEIPIFIGDFVLANYGTGALMAVPAHDGRDYAFAKKYGLKIKEVISGNTTEKPFYDKAEYLLNDNAKLINSGKFNNLTVKDGKNAIINELINNKIAKKKLNFKMRDWVFSRQRYWGEPIPIVNCEKCGMVPVPENELPLTLPNVESYEPTKDGESPLSAISDWVNTTCPKCGGKAKRETDTMPGWAGSSWYFMRYCDPHNDKEFASKEALKLWMPVQIYNGGNEHTTRHLLYARFWVKAFYDMGLVPFDEPFMTRISQGLIMGANGVKMSKSLGNVVDPVEVINEFGTDSLRLWEMFIGDYPDTVNWSDDGVKACFKFLSRVFKIQEFMTDENETEELKIILNQTIKKVTEDIENYKFNTAVSQLMILTNEIYKTQKISKNEYKKLLLILNPFCPHMTEEIWNNCKFNSKIYEEKWPEYDINYLEKNDVKIPVQINGKLKLIIEINKSYSPEMVLDLAINKLQEKLKENINKNEIKKIIYVPQKIINLII